MLMTILGFLASGFYGMAYVAPKPFCYIALALSTILVAFLRGH